MKKCFFIWCSLLLLITAPLVLASEEETSYIYRNESGEIVQSDTFELGEGAIPITSEDEYNNLYSGIADQEEQQALLKEYFDEQSKEHETYTTVSDNKKIVIVSAEDEIRKQYIEDYYYVYLIQYQKVVTRDEDGKEASAVLILSYDVSDSINLKPYKAGDIIYGYLEYVSQTDSSYNMVNHGYTDKEIAYVSANVQERSLGVILLTITTILLLLLYAGKRGAKILIPALVLIDLLYIVLIPRIELGSNIILIASLISLELIILIATLRTGWNKKTLVSIIASLVVVVFIAVIGFLFSGANTLTGRGILSEEMYDLSSNVYYIDYTMKTKVNASDFMISLLILFSSLVTVSISTKITTLSEKYAGTEGMIDSIIVEAKEIVGDYPLLIAGFFMVFYLPTYMITAFNHPTFELLFYSESLVSILAIGLLTVISSLIISPITAIVSYLFMGEVEIKRLEE